MSEQLGLAVGATKIVLLEGEWYWWGDWTHHRLETIEHNALRLRELYEKYVPHLKSCFGATKDANDDYFYLMISDMQEHNRLPKDRWKTVPDLPDDPLCQEGLVHVLCRDVVPPFLKQPWRGPNYGSGYFKWEDRPPVEPDELPREYTVMDPQEEKQWPYPIPEDPHLITPAPPPPPPPPPPDEFTGYTPLDDEPSEKEQTRLFG